MGKKSKTNKKRSSEHKKLLEQTREATKSFEDYKPSKFKNLSEKTYADDLPDRPKAPKLPKITTPGGDLTVKKVANPSGLPGKINKYKSKPDYSNVYKNTITPIKGPRRRPDPKQTKYSDKSALGPSGPDYKPANKGFSQWGPGVKRTNTKSGALGVPSTTEGGPKAPNYKKNIKLQVRQSLKADGKLSPEKYGELDKASNKFGLPRNFVHKTATKQFQNLQKKGKTMKEIMDELKGR